MTNSLRIPPKLKKGDIVRIIAPALSIAIIGEETRRYAKRVFEDTLGLRVTFGAHVEEKDAFNSSPVEDRLADLHDAYRDSSVKAVITVIGGYNSNQLLTGIDWNVIKSNPKIFCGYSDITALQNAIFATTGIVTYYGPHYSSFGQKYLDHYTIDYFKKCLFEADAYEIHPAENWTDDQWFLNQDKRSPQKNEGHWILQPGSAKGTIIGGNMSTINLLQGTKYMPEAEDVILFLEDDSDSSINIFDRMLESLLQTNYLDRIGGMVVGRFQKESKVSRQQLEHMVRSKHKLRNIPIVANVDFGHTDPRTTFPIGGKVEIRDSIITIVQH